MAESVVPSFSCLSLCRIKCNYEQGPVHSNITLTYYCKSYLAKIFWDFTLNEDIHLIATV